MTFDELDKPTRAWDAPLPDLRSPCVGGPWDGATITHRPEDTRDRELDNGRYEWDGSGYWTWHAY